MPKISGTRADRASGLLARLRVGPSLCAIGLTDGRMTEEEAQRQVRGWLESWITPDVVALVPELKGEKP